MCCKPFTGRSFIQYFIYKNYLIMRKIYVNPMAKFIGLLKVVMMVMVILGSGMKGWGQTTVTYSALPAVTCPAAPIGTISTPPSGVTFSQMSRGSGVTCVSTLGSMSGSAFNTATLAASITGSRWYTYSITSDASTPFTLNSLSIVSRVSTASAGANVSVQYSIGASPLTVIGSFTPTTSAATYSFTGLTIAVGASQVLNIFIIPNNLFAAGTTCRVENNTSATVTVAGCAAPSTQATLLSTSTPTTDGFSANWTTSTSNGTMLVVRPTAQALLAPTNGTSYAASTIWASAGIINANNRVVFRGVGTSIGTPLTGLTPGTQYTATAYEYSATDCYNLISAPSSSIYTLSTAPTANPITFTATAANATNINLAFNAASTVSASGYLIFQRQGNVATTFSPANSIAYAVGTNYGDGTLVANIPLNTTTATTIGSLTAYTQYYYTIVPYSWNGANAGTYNYYTTSNGTATATTFAITAPVIITPTATSIVNTTAILGANVTSDGGNAITTRGIVWSINATNANPTLGGVGCTTVAGIGTTGIYTVNMTGLPPNTLISYVGYATNGIGTTYTTPTTFSTLQVASQLVFGITPPATGFVATNLTTFTVEARRPDGTTDTEYTGIVTIAKASGVGNLTGTLTVAAVAGVATFTASQFDVVGTYTIAATSGSFTTAASGNIVIGILPIMIYRHDFEAATTTPYVAIPPVFDSHFNTSSWSSKNGTGAFISANGNGNVGNSLAVSTINNTPYSLTFNVTNGYQTSVTSYDFWRFSSQAGNSISSITINGTTITSGSISIPSGSNASSGTTFGQTNVSNAISGLTGTITVTINLVNGGSNGSFRLDNFILYGNITCVVPIAYTVTGGGNACVTTGVPVGLSNSQVGLNYQLYNGVTPLGSVVAGTDAAISFGNQTTAGTYTIVATNTASGCAATLNMTGSAVVTLDAATVGGTVTADQTICSGSTPTALTLAGNVGAVTKWQSASDAAFTIPTDIANTSTTLTLGALTATTYYRAVVQSGACLVANSTSALITVNPTSVAGTISSSQTICTGTQPANLTLAGNTGTIQWQSSTDNVTYTDIAGATSATLTGATIGNLSVLTYFRVVVTNSPCVAFNSAPVTISMILSPTFANLQFPSSGNVCQGSSFTSYGQVYQAGVTEAVGANSTITAEFGYNTTNNNPNSLGWTWLPATYNLQAGNNDEYTNTFIPATSGTFYYTFRFRQGTCDWVYGGYNSGFWNGTTNVNGILNVNATSAVGIASASQTICSGSAPTAISIASNVGNIQWQSSSDNITFNNIGGANSATLTLGSLTATTYYRCVVTSGVCAAATSNTVTITVDQSPTFANLQFPSTGTICEGTSFTTYGKVYQAGVTEAAAANANITAEFGYSSTNNNPNSGGWIWLPATYQGQAFNDDEYTNTFTPAASGTLYYTFRFRFGTTCPWVYGGFNGGFWNGTSNVNGVLTVNPLPTVSITSNNSPICSSANAVFNLSGTSGAVVTYNVNGGANNTVTLTGGTGVITITSAVANQTLNLVSITNGTCPAVITGSSTVSINPSGTWIGVTNTDWNTTTNWCGGTIPTAGTNVIIPLGAPNYPNITAVTALANNLSIAAGASVIVSATGVLDLYGAISNAGVFDATLGTINLSANGIALSGASIKDKTVNNLIISANAGLSATLNDTLKITGKLSFLGSNRIFNTQDNLTLVSNATGTASIGDLTNNNTNTGNNVIGKVCIERYLPAVKSWRYLATPVDIASSPTITESWREGGISLASTGYGTRIMGPDFVGPFGALTLDELTQRPSMKSYNGTSYTGITQADIASGKKIANEEGYAVFVNGDRDISGQSPDNVFGATTLRIKGNIRSGNQTFNLTTPGFLSVGNPYPSRINFVFVEKNSIAETFFIWNPNGGYYGVGRYENYTLDAMNPTHYTKNGTLNGTPYDFIESGQAFFVQSVSTGNIVIKEKDKSNGSALVSREGIQSRPGVLIPTLEINLHTNNISGNDFVADGVMLNFASNYSSTLDNSDIKKISNSVDNLAIKYATSNLVIERRPNLTEIDTIKLSLTSTRIAAYRFEIDPSVLSNTGLAAFLKDKFLQTETAVSLTAVTNVNFDITADAASKVADRFMIVFRQAVGGPLPVRFIDISATKNADKTNSIKWNVGNEINMQEYVIERSERGTNFAIIGNTVALNNNTGSNGYSFIDVAPLVQDNYYRVKAISVSGEKQYSAIVKILADTKESSIAVYPNPVTDRKVQIGFTNKIGKYTVLLVSSEGKTIYTTNIVIGSANEVKVIDLNKQVAKGQYELIITSSEAVKQVLPIMIQ
jgi:hypothetical protein